jgi:hypothetical protein
MHECARLKAALPWSALFFSVLLFVAPPAQADGEVTLSAKQWYSLLASP